MNTQPSSENADGLGPIIHTHLAYFLVPLPEPLAIRAGSQLTCWADTPEEALSGWRGDGAPPVQHVAASLVFHHRTVDGTRRTSLVSALFDLARAILPDLAYTKRASALTWDQVEEGTSPPDDELTIVEMAVPFSYEVGQETANGQPLEISEAFDRGLQFVRETQRAYYLARRRPLTLITRQRLPFAIPFGVRSLFDESGKPRPFDVPVSMYLVNSNISTRDPDLNEDELASFHFAIGAQSVSGFGAAFLDLQREAETSFYLEGNLRAAAIMSATSCEVLLDDLLAHLMWEEGMRPEEAAKLFDPYLTSRVKKRYHPRLGGTWDPSLPGPLQSWAVHVADLRNRVVHGGREPTPTETQRSLQAAKELERFLGDRVAGRVTKYPRTALTLPGAAGLKRRGKFGKYLTILQNDPGEVAWLDTFSRWRIALHRAREMMAGVATSPGPPVRVLIVVRSDGRQSWIAHDLATGMAATLDPNEVEVGGAEDLAHLEDVIRGIEHAGDYSIRVLDAKIALPQTQVWRAAYRLVPEASVMIDRSDLD